MPRATSDLAVIVLAAGLGTRMKSRLPKVLHRVANTPMIGHVVTAAARLKPRRIVLVVGPEAEMRAVEEAARAAAPGVTIVSVIQSERLGTGHAVRQASAARESIPKASGTGISTWPQLRPRARASAIVSKR